MTDRIPLDAMTSDQLDALYEQLEGDAELHARNIGTVARERQTYRAAWKEAQRVRAKAEATIARVRDALASFDGRGVLAVGATNLDIPTAGEVLDKVRAALDGPTDTDTTQPEPATVTDPEWLRQQYAAALYERERPPRDPAWADAYPVDREVFEAMADAVMRVRDRHVDQLRQRLELADADLRDYTEAESADAAAGSYAGRAEAAEQRLRLAHQARRAKEHQLDGIRRALCDAGFMQDDDPYSHADLEDVIRQAAPAEEQAPVVGDRR